ncbi:MAG TPA: PQQ-dependent sugar dehydrogenase [Pseudomonadota bacterium]|nr:PQQ-dependent sugar dehydrogenase [Pseudomonadota bacterium]
MNRCLLIAFTLVSLGCHRQPPAAPSQPQAAEPGRTTAYASERGQVQVTELVTGLVHPWALAFLPDGSMLVTERPGFLRRIGAEGAVSAPLAGVPEVYRDGQAGLLDVALSPQFGSDHLVYLAYAEPSLRGNLCGTAVARARLEDDALVDLRVVYRQEPKLSAGTHVGTRLVFDDDGLLWVTQGDNRQAKHVQDLAKLQGKLVRIHPDGAIPGDNPFVGRDDARPEIWSTGHRNMQGAALHPVTRRLWTHEHGPMGGDEINLPEAGKNYGWPLVTHGVDYSGQPVPGAVGREAPGMEPPHYVWEKSPGVSGMAFYAGDRMPGWNGNLFIGALVGSALIRLELDGDRIVHEERLLTAMHERIRDVRQGPDGYLYVLTDSDNGKLLRVGLVPAP